MTLMRNRCQAGSRYMYLVYIFASFVVPVAMAILYGLLSGSACRQVLKGVGVLFQSEREHPGKLHRTLGFCFHFCERDEESLLGRCFGRLEHGYNFLMPHRELQLEDEDRELLLRASNAMGCWLFSMLFDSVVAVALRIGRTSPHARLPVQGQHAD